MRRCNVLLCFGVLAASLPILAQQPPAPQRDSAALLTIGQALTAMSATSLLAQISSAQCTGSIQAVPGTGVQSGMFTWEHQFSASGFQFRSEFQNSARDSIFVFDGTTASTSNNGTVRSLSSYLATPLAPFHLPGVVLNIFLANPNYIVTVGTPARVQGVIANHITASLNTDSVTQIITTEDWYFDPNTGLPLRVEFRLPDSEDAKSYTKAAADFGNYQSVNGVLVPLSIANTVDGVVNSAVTIKAVQWNYPVGPSDFTLTGSAQ